MNSDPCTFSLLLGSYFLVLYILSNTTRDNTLMRSMRNRIFSIFQWLFTLFSIALLRKYAISHYLPFEPAFNCHPWAVPTNLFIGVLNQDPKKTKILIVYQCKEQQEIMKNYGKIILMDSTHKTNKQGLPLFLLVCRTPFGYQVKTIKIYIIILFTYNNVAYV